MPKYFLGLCELYWPWRHTTYNDYNIILEQHYLVVWTEKYSLSQNIHKFIYNQNRFKEAYKNIIKHYLKTNEIERANRTIRNFENILQMDDYIQLEILEIQYLDTGECVCVKKTFWLKILQKRIKERIRKVKKMRNIRNLIKREINA